MTHHPEQRLVVDVPRQQVDLWEGGRVSATWDVSTSRYGLGTGEGSLRTPTGRFRILEKIGDGTPAWSVFKARVRTGEIALPGGEEDLILTRILWLGGLDPENANTRDRYIYFHGTNREDLIGTPASHGCIRLRNDDIIGLFERTEVGTIVEIRA